MLLNASSLNNNAREREALFGRAALKWWERTRAGAARLFIISRSSSELNNNADALRSSDIERRRQASLTLSRGGGISSRFFYTKSSFRIEDFFTDGNVWRSRVLSL